MAIVVNHQDSSPGHHECLYESVGPIIQQALPSIEPITSSESPKWQLQITCSVRPNLKDKIHLQWYKTGCRGKHCRLTARRFWVQACWPAGVFLCGVCMIVLCLRGVLRFPPTARLIGDSMPVGVTVNGEYKWLSVSSCEPCDWLATCLAECQLGLAPALTWPSRVNGYSWWMDGWYKTEKSSKSSDGRSWNQRVCDALFDKQFKPLIEVRLIDYLSIN